VRVFADLAELAGDFQTFVLDVWGVLHDGAAPFPGVVEGLREMRKRGCRVLLVSNTPSSEAILALELAALGFPPDMYDGLATSGEITRAAIRGLEPVGRSWLHIGPDDRACLLDGLGFQRVDSPVRADFLLVSGLDDGQPDTESYADLLAEAFDRGRPMYCANPDLGIVGADGSITPCAGSLARMYQDMGGVVRSFGKPHAMIYDRLLSRRPGILKTETVAVGDSPATDIKGAQSAGLYAVLLAGGVAAALAGGADIASISALCRKDDIMPDAILKRFTWTTEHPPCPR